MIIVNERVRFVDTDMMGVVHHSNYFRWFEIARVAYLEQAGVKLLDLLEKGYNVPVSDVRCSYKESARYDDELAICARMLELNRAKMVFSYQVRRIKDNALLAEGVTCNVFASKEGKIRRLSDKYYNRLKVFCEKGIGE